MPASARAGRVVASTARAPRVHAVDGARCCACATNPDRPWPATPASRRRDADRRLRRHRRRPAPGLARPPPPPLRRPSRVGLGQRSGRRGPRSPARCRLRGTSTRRSTWARNRRGSRGDSVSYVPAAMVVRTGALERSAASTPDCASARTSTPSGASARPDGARYEPAVVVHHSTADVVGANRPATRLRLVGRTTRSVHGSAVAPVRMSRWSPAVWGPPGCRTTVLRRWLAGAPPAP